MGALKGWHIVVLLVVVLLLFGAPKLPELARSVGKSLHILKDEAKSLTSDDDDKPATPSSSAQDRNDAANTSTTEVTGDGDTEARGK
ncbi:Sec-independent protein translocase subunit TatA [Demequina aurantiaca]|uniref:Sec-independent protein translocase subunit TatA n=1 Tax=Demequina aurantiaca TaxID=676200 RepID=UPI003D33497E